MQASSSLSGMIHFGVYIDFFGSAKHFNGGPSESSFKETAKQPAKPSNKLQTRINHDVAQDLTHRRLAMSAMCVFQEAWLRTHHSQR